MSDSELLARHALIRILHVEDNPVDAELVREVLHRAGAQLDCLVTSSLAATTAALRSDPWDVVLCDHALPGFTARDVLAAIAADKLAVPLVLVTGVLDDHDALACIDAGATDYVLKDNLMRLPLVLERVLHEKELHAQREAAAEGWRRSQEEYHLLFQSNPQPMFVFDLGTLELLAVNAAAESVYGYASDEFLNLRLCDLVPPGREELVKQHVSEHGGKITPEFGAVEHRRKDGTTLWVELRSDLIRFDDRLASLVLVRDVTLRKHAEAARERAEAELEAMLENSPHGIYRSHPDCDHFLSVNPALVRLLGYESAEEVGRLSLLHDVYRRPEDRRSAVEAILRDPHQVLATEWKRKDGTPLLVSLHVRTVYEADGSLAHFEAVVEDQTEHRMLEEELRQAQKMEAVGRLAGGIAHDFNNLLMVMRGFAELLAERVAAPVERRNAEKILEAADRAARLIGQLLAFSRKQVLAPRVLNLNDCVAEVDKLLPRILGDHIQVVVRSAEDLHSVKVDPLQIEQVLMNLGINARDAMPHGGKLIIETSNVTVDAGYRRRHPEAVPGPYVLLTVSDTGCGMDAETRRHIFEPFFTTKRANGGTGLGLSTVYGIVRQSGGFVWVYSELKRGTTFKLYFPALLEPAERLHPPVAEAAPPAGHETILVVEDEDGVREAMTEYLRRRGYAVLAAGNGADALNVCNRFRGNIDLMVTDVVMPGMSGPELAQHLLEQRPGTRVLYVSGYTGSVLAEQLTLGASAVFLEKPFAWDAFAQKVREVLEHAEAPPAQEMAVGATVH